MDMKPIKIEITEDILKKMLSKHIIESPNKKIIVDIIFKNIYANTNEIGVTNLYHALQGVTRELKDYGFKLNEAVLVKFSNLYTYQLNTEMMEDLGIIIKGNIVATIIDYDNTRADSINIKYVSYDSNGKKKVSSDWTYPKYLIKLKEHADNYVNFDDEFNI
jgi:hypothetical protein